MLITYFWEVIAFQGSEGSFTKHQLVVINQNLFIQFWLQLSYDGYGWIYKKIVIESNGPPNQSLSMFLWRNCEYYDSLWDGIPLHCKFTPQHFITPLWQFAAIRLYSLVEGDTVRGKCFAKEHNTSTWPGLKPASLNPKYSLLTITPWCLSKG